jgi:hypothetical protein
MNRSSNWRRWSTVVRIVAAAVLVVAPLFAALSATRGWDQRGLALVRLADSAARGRDTGGAPAHIARYVALRVPAIDRLLPAGEGGTKYFEHLDGNAGIAFPATATIGIDAGNGALDAGEATEIHERAHLLHANLPREVDALLAHLPSARPTEYAAKNSGEHFGEMAARAWEIASPPRNVCVVGSPVERLRDTERAVPGSAGFVAWYLRNPVLRDVDGREQLLAEAARMTAQQRAEWETIWTALERRRLADGTFEPWRAMTVSEWLESTRLSEWRSGGWLGRLDGVAMLPSVAVAKLLSAGGQHRTPK